MVDLTTRLGPLALRTPLIAASGTVGSVVDFDGVAAWEAYGAAVAKSVSEEPWPGRPAPRLGATGSGMINAIGIQNPGVDEWVSGIGPRIEGLAVPVWGSAVGTTAQEFGKVAERLSSTGIAAIEVNLSCPNLETGQMFAMEPEPSAAVVAEVRRATNLPIGAKLSPDAADIGSVAAAVARAGADWVVLTNTMRGAAIDPETRRPVVAATTGGVSGPPLKPVALRCVLEVRERLGHYPILGCGGIRTGSDVVEYMLAGASAVAIGSIHFAEPRAGIRILRELARYCRKHRVTALRDLQGAVRPW